MIDVNTFVGSYPFRHLPHPDPDVLARVLEREGLDGAWVGHLPSAFYRDPSPGNEVLYNSLLPHGSMLRPIPTIRPDWPKWNNALDEAVTRGSPAVRAYPPQWGMAPDCRAMAELAVACAERDLTLILTTRFEDLRQRHHLDTAGDLAGAAIRFIARCNDQVRIVVTAAGRALIEEVHWGLTHDERSRVWWDISWIWGPPEDDLAHLLQTCGADRFLYGSGWPLRLAQTPRANLDILPEKLRELRLANASDAPLAR
ncbi:MAG: amidohydrolase family protein [Gemmatimonadaceae bacterium]